MDQDAPTRVGVVAAWPLLAESMGRLLDGLDGLACVGGACDRIEALRTASGADVMVVDLALQRDSGLAVVRALSEAASRVVAVGPPGPCDLNSEAVALGARGLVTKTDGVAALVSGIQTVARGEFSVDPQTLHAALARARTPERPKVGGAGLLTPREHEVVSLICAGLKNKDIGRRLHISETTVRHHLSSIFEKMGVSDRLELAIHAFRHGLAPIPGAGE